MTALNILVGAIALLFLLPVGIFFTEILLAATQTVRKASPSGERRRLAILMPAHNESSLIAGTLRSILPQLEEFDRLLLVADNCTDDTAVIARAEGAEVLVRSNLTQRGKGYALDFGIRHLTLDPPDVVIIIDADCQAAPGSVDRLARACAGTGHPIQALYLMQAALSAGLKMRVAQFAWVVKNQARPEGLHRLGLPCQLMGTGMAFPWACIRNAKLATGHIVEDLKLGLDLALAGAAPLFCPEALVSSEFPASNEGIEGQRTRWEHGHLSLIAGEVPALIGQCLRKPDRALLALTLDLGVPPLALLTLLLVAIWCASAILFAVTGATIPLRIATLDATLLLLGVLMAWLRYGRRIISLGNLAMAMLYALWKIPLYVRFLVARQIEWVRSKRDEQ